jgi:CBS domain containing-hemolysin-like protein
LAADEVREARLELGSSPLASELLGVGVLVVLSAFFSSAETALTALTVGRLKQIQEEKPKLRRYLQRWLDHPGSILATLLVANNVVNVAVSVLSARIAHFYLGTWADAIAVGAATLILLSFGEVVPKVFAKRTAPYWATRVIRPVCWIDSLLRPVSWIFSRLGAVALRGADAAGVAAEPSVTEDELEHLIDVGEREGVLAHERGEMLRSVLEFQDTMVKEIMVPRTEMVAVPVTAPLDDVLRIVQDSRHSRIPVYRDRYDNLVGVLYVKDLLRYVGRAPPAAETGWTEIVRPSPMFVPETQKVSALLHDMQTRRLHLAVIVDEFGGVSGLVTLEDVLEEIVGEIQDEDDAEEPLVQQRDDGSLLADARINLWDLGEKVEREFPDDADYETLGGFVTASLGHVPHRGESFEWNGLAFTVREADARRVHRVEIRVANPPPADTEPPAGADA